MSLKAFLEGYGLLVMYIYNFPFAKSRPGTEKRFDSNEDGITGNEARNQWFEDFI